jgi:hypothetical protein
METSLPNLKLNQQNTRETIKGIVGTIVSMFYSNFPIVK